MSLGAVSVQAINLKINLDVEGPMLNVINESVLSLIGNTPLVSLTRVIPELPFRLYAKLEGFNPGGSMKDRPATLILKQGLETGTINRETVIIESSSGNMGIGMAQACCYYGLRFICVVDAKTTLQNIRLLKAYGAEVDMVDVPDQVTGEFLQARINRVKELQDSIENSYWPNQYSNECNPLAHHQTMHEIVAALGDIDYLFCATSTCGTLRGCAEYARRHKLKTKIVAVDALGSVLFGGKSAKRLIPGHGAAIIPPLFQADLAHGHIHVSDLDSIVGCRRLANREAILSGGSSGAVMMAVEHLKDDIPADAVCVVILADRGERYLDTIFSDLWVKKHFGDVSDLWSVPLESQACVMATY